MGELLSLLSQYGYSFYPVATYGRHTPDPWTNGLAIKPHHFTHFPALNSWQLQPLHSSAAR
jgi:hypothetical protein